MEHSFDHGIGRRSFLRQSVAFSALAVLGSGGPRAEAAGSHSDPAAAELLMVGDWGYDDDHQGQMNVAKAMVRYIKAGKTSSAIDALLLLGDNWYGDLTGGVNSNRWQNQFEQMYPPDVFACPAYAVLGNHDYQMYPASKVEAELAYPRTRQTRWTMPARWYRFDFPRTRPLITFIALDSNVPFPDGSSKRGRDFTLTPAEHGEQIRWLEGQLKQTRQTPFLAVMAHHPVYSDGPHGDHKTLIRDWDPLFREHNVALYLAGHDHDLQHLQFEGHPTSFFLSGGGGAALYDLKSPEAQRTRYAQKIYGFSHLSVTPEKMTLRHLDANGQILHAFTRNTGGKIALLS